ncbi:hypothetical protein THAOC_00193, partial [Thalassiosira oceanica]
NDAVDGCQDAERRSLDLLQSLEEGRVLSVSGFLNSIVDVRLEALEGMSFETFDAVPVAIDEDAAAGGGFGGGAAPDAVVVVFGGRGTLHEPGEEEGAVGRRTRDLFEDFNYD